MSEINKKQEDKQEDLFKPSDYSESDIESLKELEKLWLKTHSTQSNLPKNEIPYHHDCWHSREMD